MSGQSGPRSRRRRAAPRPRQRSSCARSSQHGVRRRRGPAGNVPAERRVCQQENADGGAAGGLQRVRAGYCVCHELVRELQRHAAKAALRYPCRHLRNGGGVHRRALTRACAVGREAQGRDLSMRAMNQLGALRCGRGWEPAAARRRLPFAATCSRTLAALSSTHRSSTRCA